MSAGGELGVGLLLAGFLPTKQLGRRAGRELPEIQPVGGCTYIYRGLRWVGTRNNHALGQPGLHGAYYTVFQAKELLLGLGVS